MGCHWRQANEGNQPGARAKATDQSPRRAFQPVLDHCNIQALTTVFGPADRLRTCLRHRYASLLAPWARDSSLEDSRVNLLLMANRLNQRPPSPPIP
jgi:hypothetical protein